MTLLLEPFALSSQLPSVIRCIIHSTPCHTLVSVPFSSSSLRFVSPENNKDVRMWARACIQFQRSKVHRHTVTPLSFFDSPDFFFAHPYHSLTALTFVLTTSTSILLDPSHPPEDTHICSPALTTSPMGLKPSLSQISQLRPLPGPSSLVGFLTLVPLQPSPQTEDTGLSLNSSLT